MKGQQDTFRKLLYGDRAIGVSLLLQASLHACIELFGGTELKLILLKTRFARNFTQNYIKYLLQIEHREHAAVYCQLCLKALRLVHNLLKVFLCQITSYVINFMQGYQFQSILERLAGTSKRIWFKSKRYISLALGVDYF